MPSLPVFHPNIVLRDAKGNFLLLDKDTVVFIESYKRIPDVVAGGFPAYEAKGKIHNIFLSPNKIRGPRFFKLLQDDVTRDAFVKILHECGEGKIKVPGFLTLGIPLFRIVQGAFMNLMTAILTLGFASYSIQGYATTYMMPHRLYLLNTGKDIEFMFTEEVFQKMRRVPNARLGVTDFIEFWKESDEDKTGSQTAPADGQAT